MVPILIILFAGIAIAIMYNSLITRKNDVFRTFSSIDVLLRKRYDLIPNLVETARQYMGYESGVLTEITDLRGKASAPGVSQEERLKTEVLLDRQMFRLMAVAENYPELKANQSFGMLQNSWKEIEDQLAGARTIYNESVTRYNNTVEMFPTNLVAAMMNYQTKILFEAAVDDKENVKAEDLFKKS